MRCISLVTDFGHDDGYVGQMKAAALSIAPDAVLVDVCHTVPPHDVGTGAFILETACGAFPDGTIHVAVVDPGVGTPRAAIAVETERYVFIGPDNGVLGRALADHAPRRARSIADPRVVRRSGATTFDGRERFAPAAGWLARGGALDELGPAAEMPLAPAPTLPVRVTAGVATRVPIVHVDRFGNAVLDVRARDLAAAGCDPARGASLTVRAGRSTITELRTTYAPASATRGREPFLVIGSAGYVEIALDRGSAAAALGLERRDEVTLVAVPPPAVV
jgi:S-adenosylmethionine hydrolase